MAIDWSTIFALIAKLLTNIWTSATAQTMKYSSGHNLRLRDFCCQRPGSQKHRVLILTCQMAIAFVVSLMRGRKVRLNIEVHLLGIYQLDRVINKRSRMNVPGRSNS
jgi:hypothetical protein